MTLEKTQTNNLSEVLYVSDIPKRMEMSGASTYFRSLAWVFPLSLCFWTVFFNKEKVFSSMTGTRVVYCYCVMHR